VMHDWTKLQTFVISQANDQAISVYVIGNINLCTVTTTVEAREITQNHGTALRSREI
jgi:hypothetical protein